MRQMVASGGKELSLSTYVSDDHGRFENKFMIFDACISISKNGLNS